MVIPTFKPPYFFFRNQHSTDQNRIFYNTSTIQMPLKDNYKSFTIQIHILINTIVHLNYIFCTCYPTELYGLRGNWGRTLECLQNKRLS